MKTEKITNQSLRAMELEGVKAAIEELRRDLFGLRLNSKTTTVKDPSQFRKLRKNIARGLTILHQKEDERAFEMIKEMFHKMMENREEAGSQEQAQQ